jgi:hypothetical protein
MISKLGCAALVVLGTVALASCARDADPSPTYPINTDVPVVGVRDPNTARLTTPSPVVMPFTEYLAMARQAEQKAVDEWYAAKAATYASDQQETAKCMADQGFEWFIGDLSKPESQIDDGDTLPVPALPSDREQAAIYGYGLWNPAAEGSDAIVDTRLNEYLESIGVTGQQAFYEALFQDPGCAAALMEQPQGLEIDTSWYDEAISIMSGAFIGDKDGNGPGSMMTLPEMQKLNSEWGHCMVQAEALEQGDWQIDPDLSGPRNAFNIAMATRSDGTRSNVYSTDPETTTLTGSSAEVAIALADFDCRESTNYIARFADIQYKFESDWINDHKAVLDQLRAGWERWQQEEM